MTHVIEAICRRKSCRAYLERGVDQTAIEQILEAAKWAPSGVNHQPVHVAVLGNETKARLANALVKTYRSGVVPNPDYHYCPKEWSEVYKERRKACGAALYKALGIAPDDQEKRKAHWENNYHFFHAPVGMIVFMEKGMPVGSWMDAGMFIQNVLLAAQEYGLATCPQAAFAEYPDVVRQLLHLEGVDIICGIALGYADKEHLLNSYRTEREALPMFTRWYP